MVDLHTHTSASDGALTPKRLIAYAAACNLSAIAVTDHDTVAGLSEAVSAGENCGVRVIPGIELEVEHPRGAFHLLGLGLWRLGSQNTRMLAELQRMRTERNLRIVAAARNAGIPVDYEELVALAGGPVVGRPHFARLLVRKNLAISEQDAFNRYLGDGKRLYVQRERPTLDACLQLIHRAGGRAVLAHPHTLLLSWTQLEQRLRDWKAVGLDGVEAYHSNAPMKTCRRIEALARQNDLMVTAGSDFHGPQRVDRPLGRTCGDTPIDDAFAEPFLEPVTAV